MSTRSLLAGGAAAGPLFVGVVVVQLFTRDGFDIRHQPISLLSLGSAGWIQIANFVTAGALCLGLAVGLARTMTTGRGSIWLPRLVGLYGLGLVAGGVFVPDPALGYPPGTPDTIPADLSWHGAGHAVAPPFAFTALVAAALIMSRRYAAEGQRSEAAYSLATGVVALVVAAVPHPESLSWRLLVAVAVGFAWVTFVALRERSALAAHPDGTRVGAPAQSG